ncbi:putative gtp diphosphokinase rsh2, chloroplastic [Nicotiana attenuata]|uniref:Gtp diphosphokinase rsh2, chloroplastic n=1 Tax=Nicotiana attenuata TaxID=49451 RepID=A0A314L2Q2_NICAT|nr:putative gtp diphosphokinase rsh2, chloroplastic [Nicotiana attenuata]
MESSNFQNFVAANLGAGGCNWWVPDFDQLLSMKFARQVSMQGRTGKGLQNFVVLVELFASTCLWLTQMKVGARDRIVMAVGTDGGAGSLGCYLAVWDNEQGPIICWPPLDLFSHHANFMLTLKIILILANLIVELMDMSLGSYLMNQDD